jgi:hypothetical protein
MREQKGESMSEFDILEDRSKLVIIDHGNNGVDLNLIVSSLQRDLVVLVKSVTATQADETLYMVAHKLGLSESLELQAGFATFHGHRRNIGKYFMSVNSRSGYQFITPHSEGTSAVSMQLASFYCYENSTDGGETILMNVDGESKTWQGLKEKVTRARPIFKRLSSGQAMQAKALYGIRLPNDILRDDDQIVAETPSKVPGLALVEVLARTEKTYSRILGRNLYAYWDSVASYDHDLASAYLDLLKRWGLLKEPPCGIDLHQMDNAAPRRLWHSGISFLQIFKSRITHKLVPGDLIIQNNLSWTHSANNWSPNSGTRNIAAAFA